MPMTRTVISIDRDLYERARARAEDLGVSFAEFVRTLLVEKLGEERPRVDPSIVFNLGSGGPTDIARDKDKLIGEAVWAEHLRKTGQSPKR
ncbi:MAG TPA: hypothetical protein VHR17_06885 [Thermoanaerobaculia bacterium]|nr:hypothetical protein [Thermoanaerobaculia bacterium]